MKLVAGGMIMAEKRYGKPSMTNLPYELGKRIFEEMENSPRVDREAMKKRADKMEAEMYATMLKDQEAKDGK